MAVVLLLSWLIVMAYAPTTVKAFSRFTEYDLEGQIEMDIRAQSNHGAYVFKASGSGALKGSIEMDANLKNIATATDVAFSSAEIRRLSVALGTFSNGNYYLLKAKPYRDEKGGIKFASHSELNEFAILDIDTDSFVRGDYQHLINLKLEDIYYQDATKVRGWIRIRDMINMNPGEVDPQ